jgi:alpha-tubulin suppressor-like RCC1 family protein
VDQFLKSLLCKVSHYGVLYLNARSGLNDYGILGRSFQVAEANADDEDAVAVAAATPTAVTGFVTVNGLVEDGSISQVACGKSHTLYLSINGNVYSSGFYRAANGEHYRDGSEPEGHNDMPIHIGDELLSGKTVRIYSGETASYSVGITEDGNMLTWGFGNNGQVRRACNEYCPTA